MDQTQKYCEACGKNVLAVREGPNHVLHLILSIFTFGAWIIVWFLMSIRIGGWRCSQCGEQISVNWSPLIRILVVLALFSFLGTCLKNAGYNYYQFEWRSKRRSRPPEPIVPPTNISTPDSKYSVNESVLHDNRSSMTIDKQQESMEIMSYQENL
jgi:hypothetical protein